MFELLIKLYNIQKKVSLSVIYPQNQETNVNGKYAGGLRAEQKKICPARRNGEIKMEENKVVFGTGVRVWFIFCVVAGIISAIMNLVAGNFLLLIVGLALSAGYAWLLIEKKRAAFFLIAAAAVIMCIINIAVYNIFFFIAIIGLVNPLITYALLLKYWNQMD